jgi:hypothetical protein
VVRLLSIVAVIAAMFFGAGAANAAPATYEVSKTWTLSLGEDYAQISPPPANDFTLKVDCTEGGTYVHHRINDRELLWKVSPNDSNTGLYATPDFSVLRPGDVVDVEITVTCRKA